MSTLKVQGDIELIKEIVAQNEHSIQRTTSATALLSEYFKDDPEFQEILRGLEQYQEQVGNFTQACKQTIAAHAFDQAKESLSE